jgi:hypothetical protein
MRSATAFGASARAGVVVVALSATAGCVDEYHPEYHPLTSYSVRQDVSHPILVMPTRPGAAAAPARDAAATPVTDGSPGVSLAGRWSEHVDGTTCDRTVSIEQTGAGPRASVLECEAADPPPTRLDTVRYASGAWDLRVDGGDPRAASNDHLDYRLRRTDDGDFCGTVVVRGEPGGENVTHPVCWSRGPHLTEPPAGPRGWLVGRWRQQVDGSFCDDGVEVDLRGDELRVVEHSCYAISHFDNAPMTALADGDGALQLFRDLPGGGVQHYRLRRADDGTWRGELIARPPPGESGARPTVTAVRWVRP